MKAFTGKQTVARAVYKRKITAAAGKIIYFINSWTLLTYLLSLEHIDALGGQGIVCVCLH